MHSPRTRPRYCSSCGERLRRYFVRCLICSPPDFGTFAGRLQYAILRTGLIQQEIAARVGIDQGYLSSMLSGKRNPTIFIVRCTAEALGVRAGWLAFGEGDME